MAGGQSEDKAMIREAVRGLNGADAANFESAVIARLQEALDAGIIERVTKSNIRAACSAQLARGKYKRRTLQRAGYGREAKMN